MITQRSWWEYCCRELKHLNCAGYCLQTLRWQPRLAETFRNYLKATKQAERATPEILVEAVARCTVSCTTGTVKRETVDLKGFSFEKT